MNNITRVVILVAFVLPLGSCGVLRREEKPVVQPPPVEAPPEAKQTGNRMEVSFYAEEFAGKKTASGEIFNPNQLTAAHKTYPFGTKLKLTNPDNGKSTVVTVNDRGPFVKGRHLDVSKAAAASLGIMKEGVATLIVERIQ